MWECQLNKDISMDIMIVLFLLLVSIFNNIFTVILLNVVIKMVKTVPSTWSVRLHISAAHRMSCQSLTVAITMLSRRCYVCHSFACNHLQYQSV